VDPVKSNVVGCGLTVTVPDSLTIQPLLLYSKLYVVVTAGETFVKSAVF
jgi:hypothetical protein